MSWGAVIVGGVGLATSLIASSKQKKAAKKIKPEYNAYQESPYAKDQLGLTRQLFNAGMPGYSQAQQNINAAQSNFNDTVASNATDSSQALALGGLSQGVANNAYSGLSMQNNQYKGGMLDNLMQAYQAMITEGDKKYNDMMQKYQSDVNAKSALSNASAQNLGNAINTGIGLWQYGDYNSWGKKL